MATLGIAPKNYKVRKFTMVNIGLETCHSQKAQELTETTARMATFQ